MMRGRFNLCVTSAMMEVKIYSQKGLQQFIFSFNSKILNPLLHSLRLVFTGTGCRCPLGITHTVAVPITWNG